MVDLRAPAPQLPGPAAADRGGSPTGASGRRGSARSRWIDIGANLVAAPALISALAAHDLVYNHTGPVARGLAVLTVWPLVARRIAPLATFGCCLLALLGLCATSSPPFAGFALLVALYTVAAHRPARVALPALGALELVVVLEAVQQAPAGSIDDTIVVLSASAIAAVLLGTTVRIQRRYTAALEERAARLERDREREAALAAATERTAIAREMHDIVAHGLAVVITLAEGAAARAEADPVTARTAMEQVAAAGRQSLGEMRRLLGVLRGADGVPSAPQPGLARLDGLLDDIRATGLRVELRRSGRLEDLEPALQTALYRIVQEAVTNVLKHASGARAVTVELAEAADEVRFRIEDDGRAVGPGGGASGLLGMAERAAMFGGTVDTGPRGAGWVVEGRVKAVNSGDVGADR